MDLSEANQRYWDIPNKWALNIISVECLSLNCEKKTNNPQKLEKVISVPLTLRLAVNFFGMNKQKSLSLKLTSLWLPL